MGYHAHPVSIEYKSDDQVLHMVFSDDHEAAYPTPYLRGYCPCARCQGHSGHEPQWQPIKHELQVEVVDVQPVGNYALTIRWADGHDTGIYSFERLRQICPCPNCKPEGLPANERAYPAPDDGESDQ